MIATATKRKLLVLLTGNQNYLGRYSENNGLLAFLEKIWPLKDLPSSDNRFTNQYENIQQHCVRNQDWSDEQLYEQELNVINGEERYFNLFLETIVSPETRPALDEILFFVQLINNNLTATTFRLAVKDYFEGLPIYKMVEQSELSDLPPYVAVNKVPFFKDNSGVDDYPCFVLTRGDWDDYGYVTSFGLKYFKSKNAIPITFDSIKIYKRGVKRTWEGLPVKFTQLDQDFCSLLQETESYLKLKQTFPDTYYSILMGLRDAGLFRKIADAFEEDEGFRKSIIRNNEAEQLRRQIRFIISGSSTDPYKFSYNYRAPYSEETVTLHFDFEHTGDLQHRVYALIGKNGAGKTSIMSGIATALSKEEDLNLSPHKPYYSKCFTISYSIFDRFPIPEDNVAFNYVYCGLRKREGGIISETDMQADLVIMITKIKERLLIQQWHSVVTRFFEEGFLDKMFVHDSTNHRYVKDVNRQNCIETFIRFSSGESMLFYIITKIISEIRFGSLILYDEPETHLHPNAISRLITALFALVEKFQSFCIISTHSPLVIQEIHARNIMILDREDKELHIRRMSKDSFGENLSVISEEIFDNKDVNKYHLELMRRMVEQRKTYDEIIGIFKFENLPVNLNTRLYLKALIAEANG